MKHFTLLLALFSLSAAHASVNIKPGLWEVKSTVTSEGKKMDSQAKINEALNKLPSNERAEAAKKIGQKMELTDSGAVKVCLTKELLSHEDPFGREKETSRCSRNVKSQSPDRIVVDFDCRDGTTGTSEWNVVDQEHYNGKVILASAKRPKTEIDHTGTFVSSNCGSVKPLMQAPRKSANWQGKGR